MALKWQEILFKDFVTLQRGHDLTKKEMDGGPYPVIGSSGIVGYHGEFKQSGPGVVIGRSGSIGTVRFIKDNHWAHNTSLWVKDFKGNISKFVYYYLKKTDLKSYNSGGAVPSLNRNLLDNIRKNSLRVNLQERYSEIIEDYNKEKDRQTIEQTFQDLFDFVRDLDKEEKRTVKENLNEENLALFDLLCKPGLSKKSINKLKNVASELLITLKSEKLKIDHWREKETTRAEVKQYIQDYLWAEQTGLPIEDFKEPEVYNIADKVYEHIFRQYESADDNEYVVA